MNQGKILFLFTDTYPYDVGEQFVANEAEYLSQKFEKVYVFPNKKHRILRDIPVNFKIVHLFDFVKYNNISLYLKNLPLIIRIFANEFFNSTDKIKFLRILRVHLRVLLNGISNADEICRYILNEKLEAGKIYFYSYWFYDWNIVLGILKRQKKIKSFISRCHMGDIYESLWYKDKMLFQYFKMKMVNMLYPVSLHAENHLKNSFPEFSLKFKKFYLGVKDNGLNPYHSHEKFTLVSCSTLQARKRVQLIVEILKNIKFNVHWIHFGAGVMNNRIADFISQLPPNISSDFKKNIKNSEIIKFYQTIPVDLFITVSRAEGLPVSLMEAASFGIPLMGTSVFGIPEIVNSETGFLIDKDFDCKNAAEIIISFNENQDKQKFRSAARQHFLKHFNAEINYSGFADEILKNSF